MLVAPFILSACHSASYRIDESTIKIPDNWHSTTFAGDTFANQKNFWETFNDRKLNQLIVNVLSSNNDLAAATLTLKKIQTLKNTSILQTTLPSLNAEIIGKDLSLKDYGSATFNKNIGLNYEIDLFGKLAADRNMHTWEVRATEEDRQVVALNLISQTSNSYWEIAFFRQSVEIYENYFNEIEKILDLTDRQFKVGDISRSNVLEAEKNLANISAILETSKKSLAKSRLSMAVLFNRPPQQLIEVECDNLDSKIPPEIVVNLPAQIIENRPDVRAAKYRAHKALVAINKNYMLSNPTLSISGTLLEVLSNPMNAISAIFRLPIIINWNNESKIKKIEYEESVTKYRETTYQALLEIENLLSENKYYREQSQQLLKLRAFSSESAKIEKSRYLAGDISLKDFLVQQSKQFEVDIKILENKFNLLKNTMKLYIALGGKFQQEQLGMKNSSNKK
jgi:outer membrane protein TolC